MVESSLAPKWPIIVIFYGIHHQKSNFLLILAPFLPEAVEANRCYFFENWVKKLKCPHLLKPLGTIFQHNYWSFYTSEPFTLARFNMRHPVAHLTCQNFTSNVKNLFLGSTVRPQSMGKKSDALKWTTFSSRLVKFQPVQVHWNGRFWYNQILYLRTVCLWKTRKLFTYVNILEYFYRHH